MSPPEQQQELLLCMNIMQSEQGDRERKRERGEEREGVKAAEKANHVVKPRRPCPSKTNGRLSSHTTTFSYTHTH